MSLLDLLLLVLAGFVSGAINAVAGGGTFITFGALTFAGYPAIAANATSSIAQFPGYVTSALAYLGEIRVFWRSAVALATASLVGSALGALILLSLENPTFRAMVPWLLISATALFGFGPRITRWTRREGEAAGHGPGARVLAPLLQFTTAIYGGFFGAGMGIMMLATLGLTEGEDYHRLNAVKNLLSIVIAAVAVALFAQGGVIAWEAAAVMVPAVAAGGFAGVAAARRVAQGIVRGFVVTVGIVLTVYYFVTG